MLNADVTNAGFSGYSASNWYADKLSNYTLANYDTFIIWLGTNNGLTPDSLDTDGTEANYYCKIIDAIQTANPSCLIVICKVFASGGSVIYTNQAIEAIAERYNLLVINNDDLSYKLHPELHADVNNPHFGKSGYVFIANRIAEKIGEYIATNPLRGEFGYTARTN
jgi:lysophospholipase L1-like esterase